GGYAGDAHTDRSERWRGVARAQRLVRTTEGEERRRDRERTGQHAHRTLVVLGGSVEGASVAGGAVVGASVEAVGGSVVLVAGGAPVVPTGPMLIVASTWLTRGTSCARLANAPRTT